MSTKQTPAKPKQSDTIDLMKLPAHEAEALATSHGMTQAAELFGRIADAQYEREKAVQLVSQLLAAIDSCNSKTIATVAANAQAFIQANTK